MVDARAVFEAFVQAAEARDVERIIDMLADDVSMETELLSTPIHGKGTIRELMHGAMYGFDEVRVEPKKLVASGRDVAAYVNIHVRFGNDVQMLGETLATAGKEIRVVAALFMEVNEAGEIQRVMRVRDTLGIVRQLGISPQRLEALMQKLEQQLGQGVGKARSAA